MTSKKNAMSKSKSSYRGHFGKNEMAMLEKPRRVGEEMNMEVRKMFQHRLK